MSNEERCKKYIEEHCKYCKHKNENLCDIRISCVDGIVTTKCSFYERERENAIKSKKNR